MEDKHLSWFPRRAPGSEPYDVGKKDGTMRKQVGNRLRRIVVVSIGAIQECFEAMVGSHADGAFWVCLIVGIGLQKPVSHVLRKQGRNDCRGLGGLGKNKLLSALNEPIINQKHKDGKKEDHGHREGDHYRIFCHMTLVINL